MRVGRLRTIEGARGFTLVEILVALGVFALGITGVFALFGTATFTAQQAFDTTEAEALLDSVCAELEMIPQRYRPEDLMRPESRPEALLRANGGEIDANRPQDIALPVNWPGAVERREAREVSGSPRRPADSRTGRMTYDIVITPLTATVDPASGLPQCSIATVTICWQRVGRAISLEREVVVRWLR